MSATLQFNTDAARAMNKRRSEAIIAGLLLASVLGIAFWLRWRYIQTISLYVDEFTTLWAATRVQELGVPRMPSGVLYTRGLLNTYLEAIWLGVFGFSDANGRLLSVLFAMATLALTAFVGQRAWTVRVGLLAALCLALLPEAIIWGARARFYAQLQFFGLLAAWSAFAAIRSDAGREERRALVGFALLFTLALFSQEGTLLLYPPILLAMLWWRGWRWLVRPAVLACHAFCMFAIGLRFAIEIWGQPGYFETIQSTRPYVGLIFDVVGAWRVYGPLVASPTRLAWTLAALVAVGVAVLSLRAQGWRPNRLPRDCQATLFFALLFVSVYLVLLLLVGTSWREARYLLLVQPFWALVGGAGLVWIVDRLAVGAVLRWALTAAVGLVLAWLLWPGAQGVLAQQVEGYDRVLASVAATRTEDDLVLSPQPPACALVLGPCDYYAAQRGYEEFVIPRAGDGVLVDRWTGAELLHTQEQLEALLRNGRRLWFITDAFRLATRYEADFVRTVLEQFEVVHEERGVLALLADGWQEPAAPALTVPLDPPLTYGPLSLVGWERSAFTPGEPMDVTLLWQGNGPVDVQLNTSLQLLAANGERVAQVDGPPARGVLPANLIFDQPVPDFKRLDLPSDLAPGRYRLDLSVYDVDTVTPLTAPQPLAWFQVGHAAAPPAVNQPVLWADSVALLGLDGLLDAVAPGETFTVRLVWQANEPVSTDYATFLHLLDAEDAIVAQQDQLLGGAFYPTSAWTPNEPVASEHVLAVPADAVPGVYRLRTGLYQPSTGARVPTVAGEDSVELGTVPVAP